MTSNVVVPQLGESVVEARVARWLKKAGDPVSAGEPLVELETEKIDLEVGAEHAGVLVEVKRQEGEDVQVGELLGVVDTSASAEPPAGGAAKAGDEGTRAAAPGGAMTTEETAAPRAGAAAAKGRGGERQKATPTAKKVAADQQVDLAQVAGSGAGGRVVKRDVEAAAGRDRTGTPAPAPPAPKPAAAAASAGARTEERVRMSKRRATIARNLVEAQRAAALLTTFNEADMTAVMALRERHKEAFKKRHGVSLGIASFFVKASVGALKVFPRLNAEIQGDEMVLKHFYDIGVAVGAPQGLVVPVLRDADRMSFAELELGIRDFAKRANEGALTMDDLKGGTFTITNGGVFGSLLSTPIINPPQVGILGLHKIADRPMAIGGQVVVRPMMYLALTYDHRIVDGLEAVQFLVKVKELIEDPGQMLLEG
ncbi:MAG: 2-oxoglutarate dehydrogenase complex dihydrolipoyllysine-residue succinyltransferase [Vicinamibacteraceae bacterium]|nr:2-oxoglutarate dehydrogenase complex dihydrolipoyllysine-residue succinyltransferase [Vicinamibacteraceae bacterium]